MLTDSHLYGRRQGRPLRVRKTRLMDELLPKLEILLPFPRGTSAALDSQTVFQSRLTTTTFWLEIGFGGGEHLAQQAQMHPKIGFLGCEPFRNGIASLLDHIDRQNLQNISIYPGDARVLLDHLPDGCIERCFVLFADPWPKARHADRRFIGRDNIGRLRRVLVTNGDLYLATDDPTLTNWMRNAMAGAPGFRCARDETTPPPGWVKTRYEEKGLAAGRVCTYFTYVKTT